MSTPAAATTRAARLRALHDAALAIARHVGDDPEQIAAMLTTIVDSAAKAVGGRDGLLVLAQSSAWERLPPGSGPADGNLILSTGGEMRRQPVRADGLSAFALEHGRPAAVEDTTAPDGFGPYPDLVARGIRSLAIVPLVAGGEVLGALSLGFDRPGPLAPEDRELLELFAAHAAAALERLRRMDAERRAAAELARQGEELARREAEAIGLRQLDHLKGEFVASISHELRAPLTLILGYAELLDGTSAAFAPETVRSMAAAIFAGSRRLRELVDNLLDFAQVQRGEIVVQPTVYDVVPDLEGLVAEYRLREGGGRIALDAPRELTVLADRGRLIVALGHLLANALRYAPTGPIALRARADRGRVRFEVADQGPGVRPEEQARVWEKFYRGADVAGLNVQPGGGIGLALVKALTEAHGGRVGVESRLGHGARFWIELPLP